MSRILFFIICLTAIFWVPGVDAAKKFVPKKAVTARSTVSGSFSASVRYRGDKLGLLMSFLNFGSISSVTYSFTYETNGIPQGVGGTVTNANNPSADRELLFGTCSTSICTYHHNLTNARLVLTAKLTNGRTLSKGYKIKTYQ